MFLIIKKLVTTVIFLYYIDVSKTFINHLKKLYNILILIKQKSHGIMEIDNYNLRNKKTLIIKY